MIGKCIRFLALTIVALGAAVPVFAADRISSQAHEFPTETAVLIAVTMAFFNAAERAAAQQSEPSQPVIGLPSVLTPAKASPTDPALEALTDRGAVRHLTGYRINWYPVSRLLGSVDFMGTWNGNRNLVCGYVSWDLSEANAPVLEGIDVNYVDLDELASLKPAKVHEALLEANCAFGAVDANFSFFEPVN